MFSNLIRHSLRSFKRQRAYIIINILGLSIGITCSLLISLYVINETSYDKYNTKRDRIYRAILNGKIGGQELTVASSPAIKGPTMLKEFPEIEDFLRMNPEEHSRGRSGDSKVNCLLKQYITRIATSAPHNHLIAMSFRAPARNLH